MIVKLTSLVFKVTDGPLFHSTRSSCRQRVSLLSKGKVSQPCKGFWEGVCEVSWMRFAVCADETNPHVCFSGLCNDGLSRWGKDSNCVASGKALQSSTTASQTSSGPSSESSVGEVEGVGNISDHICFFCYLLSLVTLLYLYITQYNIM